MTNEQAESLLKVLGGIEESLDVIADRLGDLAMSRGMMNALDMRTEVPVIVRALNHLAEVAPE